MTAKPKNAKISRKATPSVVADCASPPGEADRLSRIAIAAYFKAEARGFLPGQELDDWLEAEAELAER